MLKLRKILLYNYIFIIILILTLLYTFIFTKIIKYESKINLNKKDLYGTILTYKIDGNSFSFILKEKNEKIRCNYYIDSLDEKNYLIKNIRFGKKIELTGKLSVPNSNTIPNTFNYKQYLYNNGIYLIFKTDNYFIKNNNINIYYKIKNIVYQKINKYKSNIYLHTFITGNKDLLKSEVNESYRDNGISHLFAISGMHINLLTLIILNFFKKIKIKENKRYYLTIILLIIYYFISVGSPSILRSILFFSLLSINKIYYFNIKILNIFLLTISLILIINPFIIYDIGFLYSLFTSLGLIIYSSKLNNKNYFLNLFKVSLIATLFSAPITLINFYEFNIVSIINNLIFVPLITFIIYPLSLITFILPFLDNSFLFMMELFNKLSSILNVFCINIYVPRINIIIFIFYYILLCFRNIKISIISLILIILFTKIYYYCDKKDYLYFLDVGQGDSILIHNSKENILIDTGGRLEYNNELWTIKNKIFNQSDTLLTFFKSIGINKIDLMLITHGDEDHAKEAINILKKFKVDKLIMNKGNYNELESKIRLLHNNTRKYNPKYFRFKIINTPLYNDENSNSIVSTLVIKNFKILFMGDSPKKVEKFLINYKLNADLIKIGHHGSKTSSDYNFLKNIKVKEAIISSGMNNRFNHPSMETLKTLNNLNIKYYDTKYYGTILYIFNNNNINKKFYFP